MKYNKTNQKNLFCISFLCLGVMHYGKKYVTTLYSLTHVLYIHFTPPRGKKLWLTADPVYVFLFWLFAQFPCHLNNIEYLPTNSYKNERDCLKNNDMTCISSKLSQSKNLQYRRH